MQNYWKHKTASKLELFQTCSFPTSATAAVVNSSTACVRRWTITMFSSGVCSLGNLRFYRWEWLYRQSNIVYFYTTLLSVFVCGFITKITIHENDIVSACLPFPWKKTKTNYFSKSCCQSANFHQNRNRKNFSISPVGAKRLKYYEHLFSVKRLVSSLFTEDLFLMQSVLL